MEEDFETTLDVKERAIEYLEHIGCPYEIIEQINNWQPQKLITPIDLNNWNKWAGVK